MSLPARTRARRICKGRGEREAAADAGAAGGLGQALGRDAAWLAGGGLAQGNAAGQQVVAAERQRKQKGEATKFRHKG